MSELAGLYHQGRRRTGITATEPQGPDTMYGLDVSVVDAKTPNVYILRPNFQDDSDCR